MIRPVKYRDLAAITAIRRVSHSNHLDWSLGATPQAWPSPQTTLFSSLLPARSMHAYVLEEGGQIYGFIQMRPRSGPDKWDIIRLVATLDRPMDVWRRLLEFACVAAGNRGATKLFANVPEDAEELEIFRQIGFYRFTSEESLSIQLNERGSVPPMPVWLRPALPRDAFAILQLYSAITPRNVQQAEGLTVRDWTPATGHLSGVLHTFGLARESPQASCSFVGEEDGRLFAWFRLRWREGLCRLSFIIHAERRQDFPELRDFIVGTARQLQPGILRVEVRDYQQELLPMFQEIGFHHRGSYALLVKHIAVQVMERRLAPVLTRA